MNVYEKKNLLLSISNAAEECDHEISGHIVNQIADKILGDMRDTVSSKDGGKIVFRDLFSLVVTPTDKIITSKIGGNTASYQQIKTRFKLATKIKKLIRGWK